MCVNGVRLFHGDVRVVFVRSGFISGGFCRSSEACDGALSVLIAWGTEGCVLCEQSVYAGLEFRAQKKRLSSFVAIQEKRDGK